MSQVPATVTAHDLSAFHPKRAIRVSLDCSRHRVEVRRPATAGLELVGGVVERCVAARTVVCALRGLVFVVFAGEGAFGVFFAKNAELFFLASVIFIPEYSEVGGGWWRLVGYQDSEQPATDHHCAGLDTTWSRWTLPLRWMQRTS